MYVKDFMATDLVTVTPQTKVSQCQDLMNGHDINRLPVIDNDRLVGLITRDVIAKASPSDATSLDRHELNYLLEKTTAGDIMKKKVITVEPNTLISQAAALMADNNIGVLVVLEADQVKGIITDKDIFKAFIDVSGYGQPGVSLVVQLHEDRAGVIEEIGDALVSANENLTHLTVYHNDEGIRIVMQVNNGHTNVLKQELESRGYQVTSVVE
ncbi:CBS domain-containing protein [Hutsoniella sourekii]|uniref:CBS domain-containing protein n=1 Tax=Hutsoniella sourekii TaxID=87650 RepID=UPI00048A2633|nr:CBS domain-containing protein [Hutsoniella sourekii]